MERLTYDFCIGGNHCWQVKGADNLECREVCQCQEDKGCKTCPIAKAFDRLAAIEDILGAEYDLDELKEVVQAKREGRVRIIAGPKPREAVCGNCGNFIRNPGTRTGVCRVQSFYRDQHGKEEPRRGIFSPSQSRKACRKFVRAEAALRREQE